MAPATKPSSRVPASVNEYTIVPLSIPPTASFPQATKHYLYLRPNAPKIPTDNTPRELFAVNLPIDATEAHLRALFATHGGGARVERVEFEGQRTGKKVTAPVTSKSQSKKRKRGEEKEKLVELPEVWDRRVGGSGWTCVVTFVDVAAMEMGVKEVKKAVKGGDEIIWGEGVEGKVPGLGAARYLSHHALRFPSTAALQASVDAYMTSFAEQEATRARALARQRAEPDEDGFVTVTRGGRMGPARLEEAQEKAEKQKEKAKGKEDFYRFQMREKRKEKANELLKGFEEDRKKVEAMKMRRNKFRPN
ncbi:MAG: putative MFS transporter [Aureobasidium pullulans]|nr:MAG: putative MFS transporter [Aureobasidium pullulans]